MATGLRATPRSHTPVSRCQQPNGPSRKNIPPIHQNQGWGCRNRAPGGKLADDLRGRWYGSQRFSRRPEPGLHIYAMNVWGVGVTQIGDEDRGNLADRGRRRQPIEHCLRVRRKSPAPAISQIRRRAMPESSNHESTADTAHGPNLAMARSATASEPARSMPTTIARCRSSGVSLPAVAASKSSCCRSLGPRQRSAVAAADGFKRIIVAIRPGTELEC